MFDYPLEVAPPVVTEETEFLRDQATPDRPEFMSNLVSLILTLDRLLFSRQVYRLHDPYQAGEKPFPPYSSRLTHILIAQNIAGTLALETGLNPTIVRAGALAHDCGQLGKGHFQERWIQEKIGPQFTHERFGIYILERLLGLKICPEVRICVLKHSWEGADNVMTAPDIPAECRLVAVAEKIAYVAVDTEEAITVLENQPELLGYSAEEAMRLLGELTELIETIPLKPGEKLPWSLIHALESQVLQESLAQKRLSFTYPPFHTLRDWLKHHIYARADNVEQEARELESASIYLRRTFPQYDPYLLLCLSDDLQIRTAARLQVGGFPGDDATDFELDILELIRNYHVLPGMNIRQSRPDTGVY
ncbi:HD domain-containing protein [Patescibacteria group bacterium]|nr:HD domain-containing protein [Patescibacteria group bacterium]